MNDCDFMVQKIRTQYMEKEYTQVDELRALDAKVKRPAHGFAYVFGSLAAIIMGCGMSLVMTDLGVILGLSEAMLPGVIIGVVGLVMALLTYPIYKKILCGRRKKYAGQILALSKEIMGESEA